MVRGARPPQEAQRIAGREVPAPRPEVRDAAAEVGLVEVGRDAQPHQAGGQAGRPIHEQAQKGVHPQDCAPADTESDQSTCQPRVSACQTGLRPPPVHASPNAHQRLA